MPLETRPIKDLNFSKECEDKQAGRTVVHDACLYLKNWSKNSENSKLLHQSKAIMADRADQGVVDAIPPYDRSSYVETGQGTRFSEEAILLGGHNITLGGKVSFLSSHTNI